MYNEITKHIKKIYNTIKSNKYTAGEKVKETFIEIFIIVFAVSLSIWLQSLPTKSKRPAEAGHPFPECKHSLL
ncbi:MAG TPA: hypothetical protein VHA56_20020 [Mucilaginibacter sp.]|nr:hypothetical protein [Mucilaginibacter sp.]